MDIVEAIELDWWIFQFNSIKQVVLREKSEADLTVNKAAIKIQGR